MKNIRWLMVAAGALLALVAGSATVCADEIVVLRLDDTVQLATQQYIERGLAEAASSSARLVVLELDTPGGLIDSTRDITSAITGSKVPVVTYVSPSGARAASAGFFLLLAGDIAAMAPGTNTGAAHPVLVPMIPTDDSEVPDVMVEKVTSDAAAMIRSIAQDRGRNEEQAVKAVTEVLSFTASEALELDLIDQVAPSLDELLKAIDGTEVTRIDGSTQVLDLKGCTLVRIEPNAEEKFRSWLASPMVVLLLMAVAALGIYTEITHPGGIFPGVAGAIALLLFLYASSVLPVNWLGLVLILAALVLFALEVKVTSFGLLTAGGLACFILGALMLFDTPIPEMRLGLGVILPVALTVAAVTIFLLNRVVKAHQTRAMTGAEGLVGEVGRTLSELAPEGTVKVHGEYWNARTVAEPVPEGTRVRVVAVHAGRIDVAAVTDDDTGG